MLTSAAEQDIYDINPIKEHKAFNSVFKEGKLTLGFNAPLQGYPDSPFPDIENYNNQIELIKLLDNSNASALWLRDVPFYDPSFGDVGQVYDPLVYAGWLAAITKRIAIGTAGLVAPLREPIITAKQIASVDYLLGGRFLAGFASGDRHTEYPAFGVDYTTRSERYQESTHVMRRLTEESFPIIETQYHGTFHGNIDLVPKPAAPRIPFIAIGRAGQSIEWLARNADAWIWHGNPDRMSDIVPEWRRLTAHRGFVPYGFGVTFDLDAEPNAPLIPGRILKGGRNAFLSFLLRQQELGVNHIALNMKPTRRKPQDVLMEFQEHILRHFVF